MKGCKAPSIIDHTINYYKNKLFIFGGCNGKREFGDLYKIKLGGVPQEQPQNNQRRGSQQKSEVLEGDGFDEISIVSPKGDTPTPRYGHTAVIFKDFLYVFGGWDGTRTLNDLYQYSFSKIKFW